jgi:RNA polymerase sigma-70 factor (ECF subfamily)
MQSVVRCDETALKALYERYSRLIFTVALRRLNDRGLAEEVLQDVFIRCWQQAATYRPDAGSVPAWLLGITRNRTVDVQRRASRCPWQVDAPGRHPARVERQYQADGAELTALRLVVQEALAELTPLQRRAICLAYYGGLSQSQIAEQLGKPLGTIKTCTRAAMARLRRSLRTVMLPEEEVWTS